MDKIIRSIVFIMIEQSLASSGANKILMDKTAVVLVQRIRQMPSMVKLLIYASTFIFDGAGFFYRGCAFSRQHYLSQQKMMASIERCRWYPIKQFFRFYQKFSLYIYFALCEESGL